MVDLEYPIVARWQGSGREGAGRLEAAGRGYDWSVPADMGGRGIGTSPEELLVSAVTTCYTSTLFGLLNRAGLPVADLEVSARGLVKDFPGPQARFAGVRVAPTVHGADPDRAGEYADRARAARDRCFIGRTLRGNADYEVGEVTLVPVAGQTKRIPGEAA